MPLPFLFLPCQLTWKNGKVMIDVIIRYGIKVSEKIANWHQKKTGGSEAAAAVLVFQGCNLDQKGLKSAHIEDQLVSLWIFPSFLEPLWFFVWWDCIFTPVKVFEWLYWGNNQYQVIKQRLSLTSRNMHCMGLASSWDLIEKNWYLQGLKDRQQTTNKQAFDDLKFAHSATASGSKAHSEINNVDGQASSIKHMLLWLSIRPGWTAILFLASMSTQSVAPTAGPGSKRFIHICQTGSGSV